MFRSFEKRTKSVLYLITWILYAFCHAVSTYFILRTTIGLLIVDAVVHATIFACLGLLLWHILRYGKYENLLPIQQSINYIALGILTISLWLGIGFLLDYILLQDVAILFLPTLPIRAMIALLLYLIFILLFSQANNPISEQNNDLEQKEAPDATREIIDRVTIKTGQKLHIIPIQEIIYIQSDGDYVQLITQNGKYLKEQTMKYFETHLPQNRFVRIHRSSIVNIEHIARIESYGKQNQQITLKNGQWLRVSLSGYKLLKEALRL